MENNIEIKKLDHRTVDVFWYSGWENWARMQGGSKGYWRLIKGKPMPDDVFTEFKTLVKEI